MCVGVRVVRDCLLSDVAKVFGPWAVGDDRTRVWHD